VLETPYELSWIAIFDAASNDLIWHHTVETNMDAANWDAVYE
jgi:hypothetical protein